MAAKPLTLHRENTLIIPPCSAQLTLKVETLDNGKVRFGVTASDGEPWNEWLALDVVSLTIRQAG